MSALGPTGESVARNMKLLRVVKGLSLRDVEQLLEKHGHPIAHSGLSKIENRIRRVDVDDLTAIAFVLGVTPLSLLAQTIAFGVEGSHVTRGGQWIVGERADEILDLRDEEDRL